jgi:hypothetical protein
MDHLYDDGICGQPNRLFAAQNIVQITVRVLNHILVKDKNLNWTVVYFYFGSTLTTILENGLRNVSKLLIFLPGVGLRTYCLTY